MNSYPSLHLKRGKENSIKRFHPWVFSGAIFKADPNIEEGDPVYVRDVEGSILGTGLSQMGSIVVRLLDFKEVELTPNYWEEKIASAFALRKNLGLINNPQTNVFRLVHGEGDQLPGLIVDVYGDTAVIQCHSPGMYLLRENLAKAIQSSTEGHIKNVYDKSSETLPGSWRKKAVNQYLIGGGKDGDVVKENGIPFEVNWVTGQKTGFFIDQRENRAFLGEIAKDKKILNTFCYSGGFSVYALQMGAKEVHSLDSSTKAIELTDKNIVLNRFEDKHRSIVADAIPYIRKMEEEYDIIILDPPAFAKHLGAKHNAIQGYKRLNEEAIRRIRKGGFLMTYSCSQVIDMETFTGAVLAGAIPTGRKVSILKRFHQPPDHPISIYHPEGEYLKGLLLAID